MPVGLWGRWKGRGSLWGVLALHDPPFLQAPVKGVRQAWSAASRMCSSASNTIQRVMACAHQPPKTTDAWTDATPAM